MRIFYLAEELIPSHTAHSIYLMNICEALASLGNDVTLVIPKRHSGDTNLQSIYDQYGTKTRFRIKYLPWPAVKGKAYFFAAMASMFARFKRADVVITYAPKLAFTSCKAGLHLIIDAHFPVNRKRRVNNFLFESSLRSKYFIRMVVNCQALGNYYETLYASLNGRVVVAHNGSKGVVSGVALPRKTQEFSVGYVGNLYAGRGLELIEALAQRSPWAQFFVVGKLGTSVSDSTPVNLHFEGFLEPSRINELRDRFDVLLAPYQLTFDVNNGKGDSRYMSPMKIFDYMSFGKAIIASDLPAISEVLAHNKSAILCSPGNVDEWYNALVSLYENADLRARIGKEARQRLLSNYTWKHRAERMVGWQN